eukprot:UN05887
MSEKFGSEQNQIKMQHNYLCKTEIIPIIAVYLVIIVLYLLAFHQIPIIPIIIKI